MTPLPRRAEPVRHGRESHPYMLGPLDRKQRIGGTGSDARKILAKVAGNLVGKDDRRGIHLMENDRSVRTGLHAIIAFGAAVEEQSFLDRAGRPEPVFSDNRRLFLRLSLSMLRKFLCSSSDGEHRIFEKVAPAVLWIASHGVKPISNFRSRRAYMTPSARSL